MTSNQIKLIACISMLIDHAALELLGNVGYLRAVGRIAMPLFAYLIGEGCRYTRNRSKYFLRIFALGVFCQGVYTVAELSSGSFNSVHLNILITFSVAILLSFAFLRFEEKKKYSLPALILTVALVVLFELFCRKSKSLVGISVAYDYGIFGVILPLVSAMFADRKPRLIAFSMALTVFAVYNALSHPVLCVCFAGTTDYIYVQRQKRKPPIQIRFLHLLSGASCNNLCYKTFNLIKTAHTRLSMGYSYVSMLLYLL